MTIRWFFFLWAAGATVWLTSPSLDLLGVTAGPHSDAIIVSNLAAIIGLLNYNGPDCIQLENDDPKSGGNPKCARSNRRFDSSSGQYCRSDVNGRFGANWASGGYTRFESLRDIR